MFAFHTGVDIPTSRALLAVTDEDLTIPRIGLGGSSELGSDQ
jgi:hypothetical protein